MSEGITDALVLARTLARQGERAAIVAWLREQGEEDANYSARHWARRIEVGEHIGSQT